MGCAESTVSTEQENQTFRATTQLIFYPDFADRSFSSSEDFTISTGFKGVNYTWPKGKGKFSKNSNEISFKGENINCNIASRRLIINGRRIFEFKEGDKIRITGDGEVFVNDVEVKQQ